MEDGMKVFVVWEGEYEQSFPVLFATRELAEAHALPEAEQTWERQSGRWAEMERSGMKPEVIARIRSQQEAIGRDKWVQARAAEAVSQMEVDGLADSLDAALADLEVALPEGWELRVLQLTVLGWAAVAANRHTLQEEEETALGKGPSLIAAVRALTEKLREHQTAAR